MSHVRDTRLHSSVQYTGYRVFVFFLCSPCTQCPCYLNTFLIFPSEVVEHTCSITSLMLGETLPSITKDMDSYTYRLPLGVCAGIAPFNFPAMIPLWMYPMGLVCGNTYLMKPSERVPGATMLLAKLLQDSGAPDGTLNIIHGQHDGKGNSVYFGNKHGKKSHCIAV